MEASKGNGKQSYAERQLVKNIGEDLFLDWCFKNQWKTYRLGFDEKEKNVDNFFKLNPLLRNMPDFVITKKDKIRVINVKGTANIKTKEINLLPNIINLYSSENAPLVYAFCFENIDPIFKKVDEVLKLWSSSEDQKWHDGVFYRKLNLG